jgi:hypothetical protein
MAAWREPVCEPKGQRQVHMRYIDERTYPEVRKRFYSTFRNATYVTCNNFIFFIIRDLSPIMALW